MGQDRLGAPATVDSDRPGAFAMAPFATEHDSHDDQRGTRGTRRESDVKNSADSASSAFVRDQPPAASHQSLVSALRRCRQPVPARAVIEDGRPTRLTTDRRGFAGGRVLAATGPWRTSGDWWAGLWNRDEWDVALADGGVYRVFRDRDTDAWFVDAIVD
jgi:hypothetical protein